MSEIMGGDQELVGFLRRLVGYWLTADVRDQILPIFLGHGSNGKTCFLRIIESLLGPDYSMSAPTDFLLLKQNAAHPTEQTDLFGRRLVTCVEIPAGRRLDEAMLKKLTGGESVRARRMREDYWQFDPTHKLVMSANARPIVRGTDDGIWRRLPLVPFLVRFWDPTKGESGPAELKVDPKLFHTLLGELPGILNWALLGCLEWQKEGLALPAAVIAASEDYRSESDTLADFFDASCITDDPHAREVAGRIYDSYCQWCKQNGHDPDNATVFGRKLTERGYACEKKSGVKYRLGIKLPSVPKTENVKF